MLVSFYIQNHAQPSLFFETENVVKRLVDLARFSYDYVSKNKSLPYLLNQDHIGMCLK